MADAAAPAPQTPPAAGAPPAPAAAAPAAPAAPPAPAAPAAPRAAAPPKPRSGNVDDIQLDKHPKLLKRLRQEAARQATRLIQDKFPGMSLDEAAELVRKAGAAIDGAPAAAGGAPPVAAVPGSDREKRMLERRVAKLTERVAKSKRKIISTKTRARDEVIELELRLDALRSGVKDDQASFALWEYRRAAQAAPDAESIPEPGAFFAGMRATYPQCFVGAAATPPVVTLKPTSAPPVSLQPGGERPQDAPAGSGPPQVDAFKMSDEEFRRHKASYGVR
jgi:hypothetical protein